MNDMGQTHNVHNIRFERAAAATTVREGDSFSLSVSATHARSCCICYQMSGGGNGGNGASGVTSRHAPSGTRYAAARLVARATHWKSLRARIREEEEEEEEEGQERTAVVAAALL